MKYFQADWKNKCERSLLLAKQLGNIYTGSLYNGLLSLICDEEIDMTGKQVMMFSYGSGCAASMFVLRFTDQYKQISKVASFKDRLAKRVKVSAEEYDSVMSKREQNYGKSDFSPKVNNLLLIFRMQSQLLKTVLST